MSGCPECANEGKNRPAWIDPKTGKVVPAGRCFTHHKAKVRADKARAHGNRIGNSFQITADEYRLIKEYQGGFCFICGIAKGITRNLSVDHDHAKADEVCGHDPKTGCPNCIRGLLCSKCNSFLGYVRDNPDAFRRGAWYLEHPPAQEVLNHES